MFIFLENCIFREIFALTSCINVISHSNSLNVSTLGFLLSLVLCELKMSTIYTEEVYIENVCDFYSFP